MAAKPVSEALLRWYEGEARALPWRAPPGAPPPDPYRVWLSEVMLQQTTVAAVKPYFARFTQRWPTVEALAEADRADVMAAWAGLGYYARARNLHACAKAVAADHGGRFPETEDELRALPGIGAYIGAAVAAIAFGEAATVVDANVERVISRLCAIETPLPKARAEIRRLAEPLTPADRAGDFAQAMMDLGATVCTVRDPDCPQCPLQAMCAAAASDDPARFPLKAPKKPKPVRRGTAFWLEHERSVLLVRRPARGMLGGMRALPSGPWHDKSPGLAEAPADIDWAAFGTVSHVFTHFALELDIVGGRALTDTGVEGEWWPVDAIEDAGLPTLFAKAAALALAQRENDQ
ncbi:A/G-specific adenine glycosylase [Parasphingopyxis algicola]|uniref:A/G-specific adenine glycosylase n=1 Tax=Parasphingopyxis algicola TaxID=2026624 RepID=UPI0015A4A28F|nr:A/G-specific adenine glycosylase [Parasphingopyxis algicola]QLC24988.1 A/G-specific adenine glycosylase [Parasphingopyxis algicola]